MTKIKSAGVFSYLTLQNQTDSCPPFPSVVVSSLLIPAVTFEARVGRQSASTTVNGLAVLELAYKW